MESNLKYISRNKAGEILKEEACTLDHTIGSLIDFSLDTDEKYGLVEIKDQAKPDFTVYILGDGVDEFQGHRSHRNLEVVIEINLSIPFNSHVRNLEPDYKTYLEKTINPFKAIILVGGVIDIQLKHLENSLTCSVTYEMYEEPYHYMLDIYSIFEQAHQLNEFLLNFEKN